MTTYYKVISADNKSLHGGDWDWTPYLPKGKRKGKWLPDRDPNRCGSGWHITKYWNMWYKAGARIFECEYKSKVEFRGVGVEDKVVCRTIRLVREIRPEFDGHRSTGNYSTGNCSTGNYSTGDCSTGCRSTGNYSTGNYSTGNYSTGSRSTGNYSTGNCSTGNYSTGCRSTGNCSTGDCSTGYRSTGRRSTGNCSTGNCSTGDRSTGHWSIADMAVGYFATEWGAPAGLFNVPMTREELDRVVFPDWLYTVDFLEYDDNGCPTREKTRAEAWRDAWEAADEADRERVRDLPNFDADVFYEISGIDLREGDNDDGPIEKLVAPEAST